MGVREGRMGVREGRMGGGREGWEKEEGRKD